MHPYLTRMPSLIALRAFIVLGETRSMRRTGEVLRTDHASISRHIAGLEASLGVALVEKHKRGLSLTATGEAYHRKVRRAFDSLCDATAMLRPAAPRSLLIHATPGLAHETLLPGIPKLSQVLGDLRINLITGVESRIETPAGEGIHVHVRFGALPDLPADHMQVPLHAPRLFPVASPAFLARYPAIDSIEAMLRLPLLHSDETGVWDRWIEVAGAQRPDRLDGIEMPNTHLALQAAALGQGIALGNSILSRGAIARGELVEILDTAVTVDAYHIVCARAHWDTPPIVALRRWLDGELSAAPLS
ncbi:LysR substrate-binding domain-containing protein [Bosea sp. (in: a-proteobacteria)]|uniref:LysR substrate-binding domain-containing protein n=1 Tax=Bosea sp. (in: a-proteobacteria) TaxID=1871050 RepID=UPI002638CE7D|nr:LysR substrate-binding domain-containing protein [Bosea sp. (in: a-proteobacteria)]MCO5093144.1 LysR substrate-binding domain-containing protein [Bosea sp. (in: a-proteobacteria)]